jgi:hypothetical protein
MEQPKQEPKIEEPQPTFNTNTFRKEAINLGQSNIISNRFHRR